MALRDELSKLDSEVAAGQITAEEFRVRRDRILASAGSGPATGGPFPPPYRWGEEPAADEQTPSVTPRAPVEDRTQVVRRAAPGAPSTPMTAERTQVVPSRCFHSPCFDSPASTPPAPTPPAPTPRAPRSPAPTPAMAVPDDRTQVVPRGAPPSQPQSAEADRTQVVRPGAATSGYSNVGAPPWARGTTGAAGNRSAPPLRPEGTLPPWTLDQPIAAAPTRYANGAAFGATRHHKWLLPAIAVVVVLLVIGIVLWFVL